MESEADMLNERGKISEAPSLTFFSAFGCRGADARLTNIRGIPLHAQADFIKEVVKIAT